jgi:proteasome lid subunit RPN8/RPN11
MVQCRFRIAPRKGTTTGVFIEKSGLIMLVIEQRVIEEVIAHAKSEVSLEVCGFLAEGEGVVCQSLPLRNVDASPKHFSLDPQEQFDALGEIRSKGLVLRAIYHSHPASPAQPSKEDIRLAYDSNLSYVIVSLAAMQPDLQSFKIANGKVTAEEIVIANAIPVSHFRDDTNTG